jgi:hypothetical protein
LFDAAFYGLVRDDQIFLASWELLLEGLIGPGDVDQMSQASMQLLQGGETHMRHSETSQV